MGAKGPALPGRSRDCNFSRGLQIAASGTSNRKVWSLGNRNLTGVNKRNVLAESSTDLLKKKYWMKPECPPHLHQGKNFEVFGNQA